MPTGLKSPKSGRLAEPLRIIDSQKTFATGLLVLCINIVLMGIKIAVGLIGNSYALIADGMESAADILSSLIAWAGFQFSLKPADEDHPFGHGKLESLAGVLSGLALLAAAGIIAWHAFLEILTPHHAPAWFTLPVLLGVALIKLLLSGRIMRMGADLDSRALESDAWHHRSDAITSTAAAIGIAVALIGGPGWEAADDYAALLACSIIAINGLLITKNALHEVLDGSVPERFAERIRTLSQEVAGVQSIEKCRVRKSGIGIFVEIHVRVDGSISVREGHQIGHDVKDHLLKADLRILDAIVHLEPENPPSPRRLPQ